MAATTTLDLALFSAAVLGFRHGFDYDPAVFKEYPTRQAAYEALIAVWPLLALGDSGLPLREAQS